MLRWPQWISSGNTAAIPVNYRGLKVKLVLSVFIGMLIFLQYTFWAGKQNVIDLYRLNRHVDDIRIENQEFQDRNDRLHVDVIDIKNGLGAIESRARFDLGLIKPGETYYQIVRSEPDQNR
jgi:cell division protein FtsB